MKKFIYIIIFLFVVIGIWFWWHNSRSENQVLVEPSAPETNQLNLPFVQTNSTVAHAAVTKPKLTTNITSLGEQPEQTQATESGKDEWRTPIVFYGKVVNENGNPVAEAKVDFSCNDLSAEGTSFYHRTSDDQGLFSIMGITGKLLTVKVGKDDYYTSKKDNGSFYYAGQNVNFTPDASNPVIFHLRKKGKTDPLVVTDYPGFAKIAQLRLDGTPIELDLLKGAQVSSGGGQLELEFSRDISTKNARSYDWKLQVSAPGGGLIGTDEEFAFEAPQNGYQPVIVIDMPATNQNWRPEIRSKYYIQLANGNYGEVDLYFLARNGVFTVHSAVNPSGSRNIEPQ